MEKKTDVFSRIRENLLRNTQADPQYRKEKRGAAPQDGSQKIPENSLLYTLWQEWEEEMSGRAETSVLEVKFDPSDADRVCLTKEELETEEKKAVLALMMKARMRHQMASAQGEKGGAPLDAEIVLHTSKDRMAVWAFVFPPVNDGRHVSRQLFDLTLAEQSVVGGLKEETIERIIQERLYFRLFLIACGTPAIQGSDGYVIEKYARHPEKVYGIGEDGKVDYRVQNNVQEIHAGDVICEAVDAVRGQDGADVNGNVLEPSPVKEAKLSGGPNTRLSEDSRQLVAAMDGHLEFKAGRFQVDPAYYVRGDVDLHVGNIDFHGDVHITGDVRENFVIRSGGSVIVGGLVEGAVIEAGGDVTISEGILGEEKAVIKAGGNVQASFIESAIIFAGGDVHAGSIISSEIYCDNVIKVRTGHGTVIGGTLMAGRQIDADVIGSRAERLTTLVVGEMPYVQKQKEELITALRQIQEEHAQITQTLERLDSLEIGGMTAQTAKKAADYRLRRSVLDMQTAHLQKQLSELEDKQWSLTDSRITADHIYPVTDITLLGQQIQIRDKVRDFNNIRIVDGEIRMGREQAVER